MGAGQPFRRFRNRKIQRNREIMKIYHLVILVLACAGLRFGQIKQPPPAKPETNLLYLKSWDGKYPDGDTETAQSFYELPEIKAPLLRFLSKKDFMRLSGKSEPTGAHAIRIHDNFLFADNCKYQCCECRTNLLVVNLENGAMYAFFIDLNSTGSRENVRFVSFEGKKATLPKELCKYQDDGIPDLGCDK